MSDLTRHDLQDVTIAAIQMTAVAGDIEGNLTSIDRLLGDAIGQGADIVRFTELSVCGYNTQLVISPDGIEGKYRKSHVHTTEISTRRHGDGLPIFDHPKIRFGVEICYGTHFPEISTALADKGAERIFLSHASEVPSPHPISRRAGNGLSPSRVYDNTVFAAICNQMGDNQAGHVFLGVTFVCDPTGKLMIQSSDGSSEEIVLANLKANVLEDACHVPETFFRHFQRPEIYETTEND